MPDLQTSDMRRSHTVNDFSAPLASARLSMLWIQFINDHLDGDLCKHFFYFHIFSLFLIINHDFITDTYLTPIADSNAASDDVTNQATNRILNRDLLCSCAHFLVKIEITSSFIDGF